MAESHRLTPSSPIGVLSFHSYVPSFEEAPTVFRKSQTLVLKAARAANSFFVIRRAKIIAPAVVLVMGRSHGERGDNDQAGVYSSACSAANASSSSESRSAKHSETIKA